MTNRRQLIFVVANCLLHYKLKLSMLVKNFNVACALKVVFTPALNILLKLLVMGA